MTWFSYCFLPICPLKVYFREKMHVISEILIQNSLDIVINDQAGDQTTTKTMIDHKDR